MEYQVRPADLAAPADRAAIVRLLDLYARDPMGGGQPLPADVHDRLPDGLAAHPGARVWLALADDGTPAGIAVCFLGFSTFAARPLLNIHDLAVAPDHRGRGLGRRLIETVAAAARSLGCCKLTLEVRDDNATAQRLYRGVGFGDGPAPYRFLTRPL